MAINTQRVRELLRQFDFRRLFAEELAWASPAPRVTHLEVDGKTYAATPVAEQGGMMVFEVLDAKEGLIPGRDIQLKATRRIAQTYAEHILIFVNAARTSSLWLWVKRQDGRLKPNDHWYHRTQPGDSLLQKLAGIAFELDELDEEGRASIGLVLDRMDAAFHAERVTKRFYEQFAKEHAVFLKFINGIPDEDMQKWYASVMLNRLMFIYFIQKKGFLGGDQDYLRHKLEAGDYKRGFYHDFLCPLFFKGFAQKEEDRSEADRKLFGPVPYLNGGIFQQHEIERLHSKTIEIPDKAFAKVFDFFDDYRWHLDDRPLQRDDEINPDVLGFIFEKYINQKQMGAYYTKEDITGYISRNTILPFLFDAVRQKCRSVFESGTGVSPVWDLLREDPDRYIYEAVRKGVDLSLPPEIAIGVDPNAPDLFERRKHWNKPAPAEYALPTEIWRETVARRQRYAEIKSTLSHQPSTISINDLITLNLDIVRFAQDVVENAEPDLLNAFYTELKAITVLDPTCGSGAFLFAALNILYPLYEACLNRMRLFLDEWQRVGDKTHRNYAKWFTAEWKAVEDHPNQRYFILKTIILNNLYGVDLMKEATEICKLRLFLKLAAQVEPAPTKPNYGIEPLPDIDFNIRAGNTLVGFASRTELEKVGANDFLLKQAVQTVLQEAEDVDQLYKRFLECQVSGDESPAAFKSQLQAKFGQLRDECDAFLADLYEMGRSKKPKALTVWKDSHQPFHWFVEFYGIMSKGGFDVIIGNPPYLEIREVDYALKNYACLDSGAIHAMCIERSGRLLYKNGCMSMIVPLSLPSTQRMEVVQKLLEANRNAWYANCAWRPAKLFDTVNRALTVFVVTSSGDGHTFATNYQKWTSDDRDGLFERLTYVEVLRKRPACWIPKLGDSIEQHVLKKCLAVKTAVKHFVSKSEHRVYYRTTGGLYWKVFTDFAPAFNLNGKKGHSSRETWFTLGKKAHARPVIAALSSDVFWWWYTVTSNVRDLNPFDIQNFPLPESALADPDLQAVGTRYLKDLDKNSTMLVREQKQTGTTETQSFKIQKSKPIIDEIDRLLAKHYGFTDEELDFIINYDIKYRMGLAGDNNDEIEV